MDGIYRLKNFSFLASTAIVVGLLLAQIASADSKPLVTIKEAGIKVTVSENPESTTSRYELKLQYVATSPFIHKAFQPEVFTIDNPTRLVVDIPNSRRAKTHAKELNHAWIHSVRLGGHTGKSRIVVELHNASGAPVGIESQKTGSVITTLFGIEGQPGTVASKKSPKKATPIAVARKVESSSPKVMSVTKKTKKKSSPPAREDKPDNKKQSVEKKVEKKKAKQQEAVNQKAKETKADQKVIAKKAVEKPKEVAPKKEVKPSVRKQAESPKNKSKTAKKTRRGPITKAYSVKDDDIAIVEIEKKKGYSKTPINEKTKGEFDATESQDASLWKKSEVDVESAEVAGTVQDTAPTNATNENLEGSSNQLEQPLESNIPDHLIPLPAGEPIDLLEEDPNMGLQELDAALPIHRPIDEGSSPLKLLFYLGVAGMLIIFLLRREQIAALYRHRREGAQSPDRYDWQGSDWRHLLKQYEILGCSETDSDSEIKARYRHLVKVFHSDKLNAQDLPDEVLALTNQQFQKVQEAYETVRELRGFN